MKPLKFFLPLLGVVLFAPLIDHAATVTFSNTNTIVINDSLNPPTLATPYPSEIQVTGLTGSVISKVTVQLLGFAHNFPDDVDIVLVGPEGQNTVLMANTGGATRTPVTNIDLILDDDAVSNLPLDSSLVSGTFKPTRRLDTFPFNFPAPAPAAPTGASLIFFQGTEPNGTWRLYVIDDTSDDSGVINGGWSMTVTTTPVILAINRDETNAVISWTNMAAGYQLQAAPSLSPLAWTNVNSVPSVVSGCFTVTNPISAGTMFYRLAK